ncbi:OLC1v1030258C1 [Oldenlandia corymbosa var. corymbosa]|uniref:OLC1v1030258C1 n=1 Tax=Oldenlandia corymbosa var. corymbosa TaxID=529605 RepID=A0AAV1CGF3_OLDCO|nr:OLC1v1030258C1 [Oldenlandia corymbosa var. corymbosa]
MNSSVFEGKRFHFHSIVFAIKTNVSCLLRVHNLRAGLRMEQQRVEHIFQVKVQLQKLKLIIMVSRKPPDPGSFILNTDGSTKESPREAGWSYVVRGEQRKMVHAACDYLGQDLSFKTEIQGILEGLKYCELQDLSTVQVQFDSKVAVDLLLKDKDFPWKFHMELTEISNILKRRCYQIIHVFREVNVVADLLAKLRSNGLHLDYDSYLEMPNKICGLLLLDQRSFSYLRIR